MRSWSNCNLMWFVDPGRFLQANAGSETNTASYGILWWHIVPTKRYKAHITAPPPAAGLPQATTRPSFLRAANALPVAQRRWTPLASNSVGQCSNKKRSTIWSTSIEWRFGQHPHIFLNINLRRHDNMDQKLAKLFCERSWDSDPKGQQPRPIFSNCFLDHS